MELLPIKPTLRPRVGLYTTGLKTYWAQFPGLRERLTGYGQFIASRLSQWSEVHCFGLVDCADRAREAGEYFNQANVDLIFCHSATYITSDSVLPIHQLCQAPVVVLNLQPAARINYAQSTTGEWLAHCGACPVPEIANAFNRAGLPFRVISGLLGQTETPPQSLADENTAGRPEAVRAWQEIEEYVQAARVRRTLRHSRIGFLGNNYSGMLDLYSDWTMLQAQVGLHVQILEMCDLDMQLQKVTNEEIEQKQAELNDFFQISGDSAADPIARKPSEDQIDWSCRVAAAQERLVLAHNLDALAYYYHGAPGNAYEKLQSGFIVGHSLLSARGIPCAGEGDIKTCLAMKICDVVGAGGSFSEIVAADYLDGTILMGHDGPFHVAIADGKPILRGMGLYHGKQGSGVSVEAKVRPGPVTMLGVTQTGDGRLRMIICEGVATDGPIMQIGNTQTPIRFPADPDACFARWFAEAPTHHFAMAVGHRASLFRKVADLLQIPAVELFAGK
jgi:L-arabinose isomerase